MTDQQKKLCSDTYLRLKRAALSAGEGGRVGGRNVNQWTDARGKR